MFLVSVFIFANATSPSTLLNGHAVYTLLKNANLLYKLSMISICFEKWISKSLPEKRPERQSKMQIQITINQTGKIKT